MSFDSLEPPRLVCIVYVRPRAGYCIVLYCIVTVMSIYSCVTSLSSVITVVSLPREAEIPYLQTF